MIYLICSNNTDTLKNNREPNNNNLKQKSK